MLGAKREVFIDQGLQWEVSYAILCQSHGQGLGFKRSFVVVGNTGDGPGEAIEDDQLVPYSSLLSLPL